MRVLMLTADLPPANHSGIGTAVAHQACHLRALGCSVAILTSAQDVKADNLRGVPVHTLPRDYFPGHLRGAEFVHLHSLRLAGLALELQRRDQSKLVYTAHSLLHLELGDGASAKRWQQVQRSVFEAADHVLFLSDEERRQALLTMPWLRGRSSVLAHGFSPSPMRERTQEGLPTILFAGRFTASKGIDVAVKAMKLVLDQTRAVHCVLAGGHGDARSQALVEDLVVRFPDRCKAPGWLDAADMELTLKEASLLVMPSRYEPFGLMALEALRLGTPVVAAAVPGLVERLSEGSGAMTVAGHAPEDWATAILQLLADVDRRRAMSASGPAFVSARFNASVQAGKYLSLLDTLQVRPPTVSHALQISHSFAPEAKAYVA